MYDATHVQILKSHFHEIFLSKIWQHDDDIMELSKFRELIIQQAIQRKMISRSYNNINKFQVKAQLQCNTKFVQHVQKFTKNSNLSHRNLKFYKEYPLPLYFQHPLALLDFKVYNSNYACFSKAGLVMGQIRVPKYGKSPKFILYRQTSMNHLLSKTNLIQFF